MFRFDPASGLLVPQQFLSQAGLDPNGNEAGDQFGASLTAADFDGDEVVDLAVGPSTDEAGYAEDAGAVFIFKGGASLLCPPEAPFTLNGVVETYFTNARFGTALAIGDFNADGRATGGRQPLKSRGFGYPPVGVCLCLSAGRLQGSRLLSDLGRTAIPMLCGGLDTDGDLFGRRLAAGDFNADGTADLAIGAPGKALVIWDQQPVNSPESGAVYTFVGSANPSVPSLLAKYQSLTDVALGSHYAGDRFGSALAAGDFTGDGVADLGGGAPGESPFLDPQSGAVHLFRAASTGQRVELAYERALTQVAVPAAGLSPNRDGDLFGTALVVGDLYGDGAGDVAVGSPGDTLQRTVRVSTVGGRRGLPLRWPRRPVADGCTAGQPQRRHLSTFARPHRHVPRCLPQRFGQRPPPPTAWHATRYPN